MTLFRSKSIGEALIGRAHRIADAAGARQPHQTLDTAREYAGQAGALASQLIGSAGRGVRRHPRLGIAIGAGIGVGAIAAAYLLSRRHTRPHAQHDEHDPTRRSTAGGDAQERPSEYSPVPGETDLY